MVSPELRSSANPGVWTVVQLTLTQNHLPYAEALLQLAGAAAVTLTDAGQTPLLEARPGNTPVWQEVCVEALFERAIDTQRLAQALGPALGTQVALRARVLEETDWHNAWRRYWKPLCFGGKLTVVPTDEPPPDPQDIVVRLNPGLAFGTGQHATTALCLDWLVDQNLAGKTVLDYGTGSGLLAIAAIKLGARHAYAVDIDPQALTACDQNARANAVRAALTLGRPADLTDVRADILLANILAEPLKALATEAASRIKPAGHLVLSGILEHQAAAVMTAYAPRFRFEPAVQREGWVRLTAELI